MVPEADLKEGQPRLLTVDREVVVPVNKNVVVGLKSNDVIHDWAVPAFGVKLDAVPGRLQTTWFRAEREGIYYGQCSELCGRNHAFMPIAVRVVSEAEFADWLAKTKTPPPLSMARARWPRPRSNASALAAPSGTIALNRSNATTEKTRKTRHGTSRPCRSSPSRRASDRHCGAGSFRPTTRTSARCTSSWR